MLSFLSPGGSPENLPRLDGINQWSTLAVNVPSPRNEVLLNIDEVLKVAALRMDTPKYFWKLVLGK